MANLTDQNWDEITDLEINVAMEELPVWAQGQGSNYCYDTILWLVNRRTGQKHGEQRIVVIANPATGNIVTTYPAHISCR